MSHRSSTEQLSLELAHAIQGVAVRSDRMSGEEILAAYDEIEASLLPRLGGDSFLALETRRRIAEWKFYLLADRDTSYELVRALLDSVRALGFSNPEKQANVEIVFARYCLREGRSGEARDALEGLCRELVQALETADSAVHRECLQTARAVLERIHDDVT